MIDSNIDRNKLVSIINCEFYNNKMPYVIFRLIDDCIEEYEFDSMVIYSLFDYARSERKQYSTTALENLARDWHKQGITTMSKVEEFLFKQMELRNVRAYVSGFFNKKLNGFDIEKVEKWVLDFGYNFDVVRYAFEVNSFRSHINIQHIDTTLSKWYERGATDLKSAISIQEEIHHDNTLRFIKRNEYTNPNNTVTISFTDEELKLVMVHSNANEITMADDIKRVYLDSIC